MRTKIEVEIVNRDLQQVKYFGHFVSTVTEDIIIPVKQVFQKKNRAT